MGKSFFRFRHFTVNQERAGMKVSTDSVLLSCLTSTSAPAQGSSPCSPRRSTRRPLLPGRRLRRERTSTLWTISGSRRTAGGSPRCTLT